ncbi:unnamed protein product [Ceutorhynchus assimilis]|uniref:Putative inorganic phosphate cotransporter n=1 Tax=Ceutorhynchus assimilis TaxID=467358 RepID=A0A9N9QNZ6_9CUCU|nr:unnamed protein product [Ceutorhynchus assimilis]
MCVNEINMEKDTMDKGPCFGSRHVQMILYFLLNMFSYALRSVLSVAIVAMNDRKITKNQNIPSYLWDDQSVILSSFYWGYVVCQLPAAYFGKKYGVKWILVGSTILDSLSCILIPTMATLLGSKGVILCRVSQGLAQGFLLPSVHTLLGHWAPPTERSRIGTFAYAGGVFGTILSMSVTGLICSGWLGWPFSFYIWGAFGLSWSFIWMIFGFDCPRTHNSICEKERDYIEKSLGQTEKKYRAVPWKGIFKSSPVWALIVTNAGINWGSTVLLTQTPTYLSKILKFDIKANALLSSSPYLAMWILSFLFSTICDWIINNNWVTRGVARKIFNSIGTICPAIGLLYLGFVTNAYMAVLILVLVGGTIGAGFCGFQVNHIDLSPNHSGVLMGLTNGFTSTFSIVSPLVVQFVVTDQTNQSQWMTIFMITAAVYALTDIVFICLASGEVQDWNESDEKTESSTNRISNNNA